MRKTKKNEEQDKKNQGDGRINRANVNTNAINAKNAKVSVEERMKEEKKYLGVLETYGVSWSLEKVARDTLQNFFDSNGQTLDGISVSITNKDDKYTIRIEGGIDYDYRYLMHIGATSKNDNEFVAGGFGEGAKILAVVLLRDNKFSQVRFGSQNWIVDYSFDPLPEGEYVDNTRGLYAKFSTTKEKSKGSFIEFVTDDSSCAEVFIKSKNLFYHSKNPDFKDPTLDIKSIGGIKYLPKSENAKQYPYGNFYYVGQRRHFDKEEWNTINHFNIWTYCNKVLRKDRDRGVITYREMEGNIIPLIINAASSDQLKNLIYETETIWPVIGSWPSNIGYELIKATASKLHKNGVKLEFNKKYLAKDLFSSNSIDEALEKEGYVLCPHFFSDIGMPKVRDRFSEMQEHYRMEATRKESKLISLLQKVIVEMGRENKEIRLYDRENEKSIVQGQYSNNFVWVAKDTFTKKFEYALVLYLHELGHKGGSHGTMGFEAEQDNTSLGITTFSIEHPNRLREFNREWNKITGIKEENKEENKEEKRDETNKDNPPKEKKSWLRRIFHF